MKTRWKVEIELKERVLGTVNKDPDWWKKWAVQEQLKKPENDLTEKEQEQLAEEETSTVPEEEQIELLGTSFHHDEDGLFLYNYMVKGCLKTAQESLEKTGDVPKIKAYKKWINRLIRIEPRRIRIPITKEQLEVVPRPGRTDTFPAMSIINISDALPVGTKLRFEILDLGLKDIDIPALLDFGQHQGLGQWHGSGDYGQFRVLSCESSEVE